MHLSSPKLILARPAFFYAFSCYSHSHRHVYPAFVRDMSTTVSIGNKTIPVLAKHPALEQHLPSILNFVPFQEWIANMNHQVNYSPNASQFNLCSILISDIDFFGKRIGFVKFTATVEWADTSKAQSVQHVPGIVFCRGGAVSLLPLLYDSQNQDTADWVSNWRESKKLPSYRDLLKHCHTVLTVQPRIPIGCFAEAALPAGMLDGDSNFSGVAAKELQEECGITVESQDLINLTEFAMSPEHESLTSTDPRHHPFSPTGGLYPSAGGCDESISLFAVLCPLSPESLASLHESQTGLREEGERISLQLVNLDHVTRSTRDLKAFASLALLQDKCA